MPNGPSYPVIGVDADGAGIVDVGPPPGRREHVPGALPGDQVHLIDGGGIEIVAMPSAARREAHLCPHFPACGGCRVQHMSDAFYEDWKGAKLEAALRARGLAAPAESMLRVPLNTRRRAVLTAKAETGGYRLGFHEHRSHALVDIKDCAILAPAIESPLDDLKEVARLVSNGSDCRLTVLDVGSGLDVSAETGKRRRQGDNLVALTRIAAKARVLRLTVDGEPLLMRAKPLLKVAGVAVEPPPGAFVQAAGEAEAAMTAIAVAAITKAKAKRVADLFCGLGAFTFALAHKARVLAIDSDRAMVAALAAATRGATGLKPIEAKVRDLFGDPLSPRELDQFDAVVFDPPRAGAKAQAEALAASKVKTVVAVSCNPATLSRDVRTLVDGGYRIERAAAIDQFLFTSHLEAVAVLTR